MVLGSAYVPSDDCFDYVILAMEESISCLCGAFHAPGGAFHAPVEHLWASLGSSAALADHFKCQNARRS